MKRKLTISITMAVALLLSGCGKHESGIDEGFKDFTTDYPEHPITVSTLNEDDIRREINAQSNFQCAEKLYIDIPQSATVYNYHYYNTFPTQLEYSLEQHQKDCKAAFEYFFPDKEMRSEYLNGGEPWEEPDGIIMPSFTYDEMPERSPEWNSPVYLYSLSHLVFTSLKMNKGGAVYLAGKVKYNWVTDEITPSFTYNTLNDFHPMNFFPCIGTYTPDSEKSFKLLDGEMKICDAVRFIEEYLNNAPSADGLPRNNQTVVYSVKVLQLDDNTYGYYFTTRCQFQGVNHEVRVKGSMRPSYDYDSTSGGWAFMIESDDVDIVNGLHKCEWTFDVQPLGSVIPLETAIKNIAGQLTDKVTFEVEAAEFVYVMRFRRDEEGYVDISVYDANVTPAWRISAHNLNDDRLYLCYVDASDGGNFRYYSVPNPGGFDD